MIRPYFCALLLLFAVAGPTVAAEPTLEELLQRFDAIQNSIQTLSADFKETTESVLLTEPIVANGRVYLTKPDLVRWEYTSPEEMRFIINQNQYTGYFPKRKQAEQRDIQRWREQLFRFLGLGQASAELAKFYEITLGEADAAVPGTQVLVLEPRKKRVRKRMDAVRFWIDSETLLPVRVEYSSKTGNRRLIEFDQMLVNPQLASTLYTEELPSDVQVSRGFSALSGFSSSTSN